MGRMSKVYNMAILLTSILAFFLWETSFNFDTTFNGIFKDDSIIPAILKLIISYVSSYGLFNLLLTTFTGFLSKFTKIKRLILHDVYVEGTWAVFYYMYGELRLEVEIFKQDLLSANCTGVGFSKDGEILGQFTKNPIYIDENTKQLTSAYTDKSVSSPCSKPGYSQFTLLPNNKKPPVMLTGCFFQLGMKKQIDCIGFNLAYNKDFGEIFGKMHEEASRKENGEDEGASQNGNIVKKCFSYYEDTATRYLKCKNEKSEVY